MAILSALPPLPSQVTGQSFQSLSCILSQHLSLVLISMYVEHRSREFFTYVVPPFVADCTPPFQLFQLKSGTPLERVLKTVQKQHCFPG